MSFDVFIMNIKIMRGVRKIIFFGSQLLFDKLALIFFCKSLQPVFIHNCLQHYSKQFIIVIIQMQNQKVHIYRKIKRVGKGNFGTAILVQSQYNRKYYIMKLINVFKMDKKERQDALKQILVLKSVKHPFIITYQQSYIDKKKDLCIIMQYAENGDLEAKIKQQRLTRKGFSQQQILKWFVQICLGLKYVHQQKILHRDLKSANIFLTSNNYCKIGDFGISKLLQKTYDLANTRIGTPYFMAPQIWMNVPYNQKSDIWSLGCILYQLTTLNQAFESSNISTAMIKITCGKYEPIPIQYSLNLRQLIDELLQLDPLKRPSVNKILQKDFLKQYKNHILQYIVTKNELEIEMKKQKSKKIYPPLHPIFNQMKSQSNIKSVKSSTCDSGYNQEQITQFKKKYLNSNQLVNMHPFTCSSTQNRQINEQSRKWSQSQRKSKLSIGTEQQEKVLNMIKSVKDQNDELIMPCNFQEQSIASLIEKKKCLLQQKLGFQIFMQIYKIIEQIENDEEMMCEKTINRMNSILGDDNLCYLPVIKSVFVYEKTFYNQINKQ